MASETTHADEAVCEDAYLMEDNEDEGMDDDSEETEEDDMSSDDEESETR